MRRTGQIGLLPAGMEAYTPPLLHPKTRPLHYPAKEQPDDRKHCQISHGVPGPTEGCNDRGVGFGCMPVDDWVCRRIAASLVTSGLGKNSAKSGTTIRPLPGRRTGTSDRWRPPTRIREAARRTAPRPLVGPLELGRIAFVAAEPSASCPESSSSTAASGRRLLLCAALLIQHLAYPCFRWRPSVNRWVLAAGILRYDQPPSTQTDYPRPKSMANNLQRRPFG